MALNPSALNFNGTTNYAKLSTSASLRNLESFTFMTWLKVGVNSINQTQRAYVERQGTGTGVRFALTPIRGKLRYELAVRDGSIDTNYDFSYTWDDYWHHTAFVGRVSGDTPTYEMFLDGASVASGTIVRTAQTEDTATRPISDTAPKGSIYLGAHSLLASGESFASSTFWQGKLDDIIILDEGITQFDILEYFQSHDHFEYADNESVKAYWQFNQNTGTSVTNVKTPAQTGTLQSSGMWTIDRPFLGDGLLDETAPTVPSSPVTSAITSDGFTATWGASTDNVYVQFYELQLSTFSNFSSYTSYDNGLVQTLKITGLTPAANYYWRVRSFDAKLNTSTYTSTMSVTTNPSGDIAPPVAPTNVSSNSVSFSSFNLTWTASTSPDRAGYQLDVSDNAEFSTFLPEYRNRDIGNVTNTTVFGASPITTYFVRLRTYDTAQNESPSSEIHRLQTTALPDLTPPLPVVAKEATSIDSREFTANWEEGIDDTRVAGYLMDIAYDMEFNNLVQTDTNYWNGADVGNVVNYRVTNLNANTTYYYRIRAYDTAGNISAIPTQFTTVTTQPPSLDEGGFVYSEQEPILNFDVVQSTPTITDDGSGGELRIGTGKEAFLYFDLTDIAGTISNVMLRFYVITGSASPISVYADDVASTVQPWNTKPAITGVVLTASAVNSASWVDIDITSLITSNAAPYTIRLTSTSGTDIVIASMQTEERPQLVLESDPQTATQVERIVISDTPVLRRNYIRNPSFESGNLTGWTTSGGSVSVATDANEAPNGTRYASMTMSGSIAELNTTYSDSPSAVGQWWTFSIMARLISTGVSPSMVITINERNAAGTIIGGTNYTSPLSLGWAHYHHTHKTVQPQCAYVDVTVAIFGSNLTVIRFDAAMFEKSTEPSSYFDGNTSGALWVGAANNSLSTYPASELSATSYYIGDADGDNSVQLVWRRPEDSDWIYVSPNSKTHNRVLKSVITTVPAGAGVYNYIKNPSVETNTTGWGVANGTSVRVEDVSAPSDYVLQATPTNSSSITSVFYQIPYSRSGPLFFRASIKAPVGSEITCFFQFDSNTGFLSAGPSTQFFGTGSYETVTASAPSVPANARFVLPIIQYESHGGLPCRIDQAQVSPSLQIMPYRDGSHPDGIWYGPVNNSYTGVSVQPNTLYEIAHIYTDLEGFFDTAADTTLTVGHEYRTQEPPDDVLTIYPMETTSTDDSIAVSIPYVGDDNENATVELSYRRSDLTTVNNLIARFDRVAKRIIAFIPNLAPGTSYTIRAFFADPDGVLNTSEGVIEHTTATITTGNAPDGVARIMYGGFVLQGNDDDSITVSEHNAFGFAERHVQIEDYSRVHGGIELNNLWRTRRIRMEGAIEAPSSGELADRLEALKQALARPRQRLVVDTLANRGRYYTATCSDFQAPQVGGRHYRHLNWTAEFVCADPFAYDAVESFQPLITIPHNGQLTLANVGHLEALPTITIGTTHTSPLTFGVNNLTTGERLVPKATIVRGDVIIVDSSRFSVRKNGIEIDYVGSFPTLMNGGNTLKFSLFATGTPTITFEMRWRSRYI